MPRKKTSKRKTCKRSRKQTGFAISAGTLLATGATAAGKWLLDKVPEWVNKAKEGAKDTLDMGLKVGAVVAPPLLEGIKYLSTKGFNALSNFFGGLWKSSHKKTIDTSKVKAVLSDMVRKLKLKDPNLENDPIMYDIIELNKTCFYIDSLNEEGLSQVMFEEMKRKLSEQLKFVITEFGKVMNNNPQMINQTPGAEQMATPNYEY